MNKLLINNEVKLDNLKAIIFDKDGTLIDIHYYWASMIKLRAMLLTEQLNVKKNIDKINSDLIELMGVNILTGRIKPDGPIGIMPRTYIVDIVAKHLRNLIPSVKNDEIEKIFKIADDHSAKDILSFLKVLPGVEDLLIQMNSCQIKSIVLSNDITSRIKLALSALNLEKYFTSIFGSDMVLKTKPEPDLAKLALSTLEYSSANVASFGDHPYDIMMGSSAKLGLNIGVLTGMSNFSKFRNLDCIIIDDLTSVSLDC